MKELRNMKTLRYLLIVIGVLSVVSVAAATFGTTYQPQRRGIQYTNNCYTQMPTLSMSTMNASMMKSGSALPLAAVSGTTTANDNAPGGPRRAKKEVNPFTGEGTAGEIGNPNEPGVPLGDVLWPLMLMALAFCGVVYLRRKKRTLNG